MGYEKRGDEKREKTLREGIREAAARPAEERLHEAPRGEPGMPEAVNLEREEPITDAARVREEGGAPERGVSKGAPVPPPGIPGYDYGQPTAASETVGEDATQGQKTPIGIHQAGAFEKEEDEEGTRR